MGRMGRTRGLGSMTGDTRVGNRVNLTFLQLPVGAQSPVVPLELGLLSVQFPEAPVDREDSLL